MITVILAGCGVRQQGPWLTLQSSHVSFGDVSLASPAIQTVTMTSSGTEAVTISAASITGPEFSLGAPRFPLTLQPGQTATLDIQFDPTTAGEATGEVSLSANTLGGGATISLAGMGNTGESGGAYEVDLNWNAPLSSSYPVAGYYIFRTVSGTSFYQLLNSSADTTTSYTDKTVSSGTTYIYYVVSVDPAGNESAPSNPFSAVIP